MVGVDVNIEHAVTTKKETREISAEYRRGFIEQPKIA
jgi:hypothetical protein